MAAIRASASAFFFCSSLLAFSIICCLFCSSSSSSFFCTIAEAPVLTLEELVFDIKKVFTYLRTGQSRNSNVSLGVIFPYVATCEYTDVSRDGNIVYHFSIITNNGHEKMLRVLSEFSYKLNEKYYLLPNKLCSDDRLNLWIEPIIISYENFDLDEEEQDELNI